MNDYDIYTTDVIYGTIAAGQSSFTFNLNIHHHEDEMSVKSMSVYNNASAGNELINIYSDLINGKILACIPESVSLLEMLNNPFHMNKPVRGQYTFTLKKLDGSYYTSDGEVQIGITCCFVKRK